MRKQRHILWVTLGSLALILVAIGSPLRADKRTAEEFTVQGSIAKVTAATEEQKKQGILGWVHLDEKAQGFGYKAVIKITKTAKIEKKAGQEQKPAAFDDLKVQTRIQASCTELAYGFQSGGSSMTAIQVLILEADSTPK